MQKHLLLSSLAVCLLPFSANLSAQPTEQSVRASEIDWVSRDKLSPEQLNQLPDVCCGLYIEPEFPVPDSNPGDRVFTGDAISSDDTGNYNILGNFEAFEEDAVIQADDGYYNSNTDIFNLQNSVRIRQPGMLLVGESAIVDQNARTSTVNNASYVLHLDGIRGTAEVIVYTDEDGIITIDNGIYSRCEPGDSSWAIAAKTMILDREAGRGIARHMTLRVRGVPILYTPYFSFPLNDQRTSGFLAPTFGSSRDGGFDFSTPYYLNLAPNYDATITPRVITERGVMLGLEGRYRGQRSTNVLSLNFLSGDKLYDSATANIPGSDSPDVEDRWLVAYDYFNRFGNDWTARIDYSAVSDQDYFQDFSNGGLATTTLDYLYRTARLDYIGRNWRFNTTARSLQLIDESVSTRNLPYDMLPSINLTGQFNNSLGMEYGIETQYVQFDRTLNPDRLSQNQIDRGDLVTGQRLTLTPEISWPWSTPGMFFTPTIKYKYASYQLTNQALNNPDNPSRGVFTGTIDSGLIFERDFEFSSSDYVQTLEPRLFYLYTEYEDQSDIPLFDSADMTFSYRQLFREDRFSGKDRVGDSNQLTLALTTRFLDDRGREKAHASIGQIIYFEDRKVSLNTTPHIDSLNASSAIAVDLSYNFNNNWRVSSYLEWDIHSRSMDVGNFRFRYQSDQSHILNLSYRYRDEPVNPINSRGIDRRIDQTDISGLWPLNDNWGLIARWNYDLANNRDLETIVGVEYGNCCWNMRLVAREWIDNDDLLLGDLEQNSGIFLQFELKGLGSVIGGNVSSILGNAITGYREHEYLQ